MQKNKSKIGKGLRLVFYPLLGIMIVLAIGLFSNDTGIAILAAMFFWAAVFIFPFYLIVIFFLPRKSDEQIANEQNIRNEISNNLQKRTLLHERTINLIWIIALLCAVLWWGF